MLLLPGCNDEQTDDGGAAASDPPVAEAAWRYVDNVQPLEISDEPLGVGSWFRRGKKDDEAVEADKVQVELEELYNKPVAASAQDVTIKAGDVEVLIPPGVIEKAEPLVVARAAKPAAVPVEGLKAVGTWEVSLGKRHVFEKPLTLRFPLPAETAEAVKGMRQPLAAMHYNQAARAWVYTPVVYNEATGHAEVRTRHLTLFTIVLRPVNNLFHDAVYTDHFSIFYSKKEILDDAEIGEKGWAGQLETDLRAHGEPVGLARQVGSGTIEVERRDDVPTYIVYLAKSLEFAWHRYKDLGLKVPEWTRTDIYVGVNSPLSDENHRGKLLGTIEIAPSSTWRPVTVRGYTAHEFFHTVQAEYLGLAVMSMNYRTWWLEALAEYAPRTVWGQTAPRRGMRANFFKLPLPTVDDSHEYDCSHFVSFLVSQKKIGFKELTVGTLDVPAGLLAMEEISAPDFALFNKLLGIEGPFDNYTASVTCGMIDRVLRERGSKLADAYAEFTAWVMFDDGCKLLAADGGKLLSLAAGHHPIGGLALDDEKVEQTLKTLPHGTADMWALAVENPLAKDGSTNRPPRKVTIEVDGEVPVLTHLDVYVLKDNVRPAGGMKPAARMALVDGPAKVEVGAKDMLYIVLSNCTSEAAQVKVRVLGGLDFRIEPAEVDSLEVREEMTFRGVSDSLPKNILPYGLKVRWSPVYGVCEETPVDAAGSGFTSSYTYAWLFKGKYTLRAELLDGKDVIATATAAVKVAMADEPSVTLEARRLIVPAGKEFSVSATADRVPAGSTYQWKIGLHKAVDTSGPQCSFTLPAAGDFDITVKVVGPEGHVLASDSGTLCVEPGEDLVWIEEHNGEGVLARRYQVFRGTHTKHGQWLEYYIGGTNEGALKERRTYVQNVRRKSETFYPDGKPQQTAHFDEKGNYHGEKSTWFADGRRALLENYAHGVKNGPYERLHTNGNSYNRHSGGYVDGKINGTLTIYGGNSATGMEYVWKTQEHFAGRQHGKSVTYLANGKVASEMEYRDGKLHGWSKSWYTWEVDKGIYYLMKETLYENGKAVRSRTYDSKGEMKSDKELK
jgi:antitoxin component YwqK of YwqJK toxin-antitoxin module